MTYKLKVFASIFIIGLFTKCLNDINQDNESYAVFKHLFFYIDNFLKDCENAVILNDSAVVNYLLGNYEKFENEENRKKSIQNKELSKKPIIEILSKKEFTIKNHLLKLYHVQFSGVEYFNNKSNSSTNEIITPANEYKIIKIDGNNHFVLKEDLLQILKGIFLSVNNAKEAELFIKTFLIINYGVDLKSNVSYVAYSFREILQKFVSIILNIGNENSIPNEDRMILEKLIIKQKKTYYIIEYQLFKRNPISNKKDLVIYCKKKLLMDASLLSIKSSIKGKIIIE